VLWDHRDTIRALRKARRTWKEIGEHLQREHKLTLTHRTIRNFYVRYTKRLKSQTLPAGFEPESTAPDPARPPAPQPPSESPSNPQPSKKAGEQYRAGLSQDDTPKPLFTEDKLINEQRETKQD
jgi:ABC-type uncharacterized transport system involved in gliding motility auxiliary subunit